MTSPENTTTSLDRLREVAAESARAANAHNTQPWELRPGTGRVEVGWRAEDALGPSDPAHRDLRLSLGTYVESLLIAAAEQSIAVDFELDLDTETRRVGRLLPADRPYDTGFRTSDIAGRRVWRGAWKPQQVDTKAIEAAQETARAAGFRVAAISTAAARPLLVRAYHWFFGDPGIAAELMAWTRLSPRHPKYRSDGLNDVMLVLNRVERFLMGLLFSPVVYRALRPLGLPRFLTPLSSSATAGDGVVLVILDKGEDTAQEVAAGRLVTRLWLDLFRQGIYVHPQSHVIDCPHTVGDLAALCGAEDGERPLVFFRVGIPAVDPSLRPRHPRRDLPQQ
ncbi:hypothetical protein ACFU6I_14840 [Streptomyces sp. NPDC057486]|uniref:hypothetical protein n=1 Tax=Streptomyces sp. NPDC057486 TaxID=3346145 RepID=UPI0036807924